MRFLWLTTAPAVGLIVSVAIFAGMRHASPAHPNDVAIADLGRQLFTDPQLSPNDSIDCANCHEPAHAFSDGRPLSIGFDHRVGTRNTPSLLDVFDGEPLFWDGRRTHLDVAVLDPLVNRVEMGNPSLTNVVEKLKADPRYRKAFAQAFHQGSQSITAKNLDKALAAFIRSLPRPYDAYDRYEAGYTDALSPQAKAGLRLFTGAAECAQCHDPTAGRFTDGKFHESGVGLEPTQGHLAALTMQVMRSDLRDAALGSTTGSNTQLAALGRFMVTHRATDIGAFRTPSLRNVALTAPYMHDGSIKTLPAAIDEELYYRGLATGKPIALTIEQRKDLLAFLRDLTSDADASLKTPYSRTLVSRYITH
jgi:cytochrome c peroxidase